MYTNIISLFLSSVDTFSKKGRLQALAVSRKLEGLKERFRYQKHLAFDIR